MPTLAGFTLDTLRGTLMPALGQVVVSTGPLVVDSSKAVAQESDFESETVVDTPEAGLDLVEDYRGALGGTSALGTATVFIKDVQPAVLKDGASGKATVHTRWILVADPAWVPDA